MRPRCWSTGAALAVLVLVAACSSSRDGAPPGAGEGAAVLAAQPTAHCPSDGGLYDGLRSYLAEHAADAPWIDRVSVCAGGMIEVDQAGLADEAARDEALEVCDVAAGYLITKPGPPERADAPNPHEIGIIVANAEGEPVVLGSEDESAAGGSEAERERERDGAAGEDQQEREAEPHRCFDPFA